MNVRGLGDRTKRTQVFTWLRNKNANIYFLQETHSTLQNEKTWVEDWGDGALYFSHGSSNSRGVCILTKNVSQFNIEKIYQDDGGRVIILDAQLENQKVTLINVYGPNVDDARFFYNILHELANFECESIIWGGDFNCVFDVNKDKKGGRQTTHSNSVNCINEIKDEYNLVDIWRLKNPELSMYTWHSKNVFCRLDFFLISCDLVAQVDKCEISPGFKTDHSAIYISVTPVKEVRGRGFWKFNTSLLHDENYVELIRNCIQENKDLYHNTLDPNTFWDFLKCQMRSVTIKYSIERAKQRRIYENTLIDKLSTLENDYTRNPSDSLLVIIQSCRDELDLLYEQKTYGAIIRSRANWFENGEKNSQYFLNLEKRNNKQKLITKIYNENGDTVSSSKGILDTVKEYYESIYTSCNPPKAIFEQLLPLGADNVKLSHNAREKCEGLITMQECLDTLKMMKNNKTPGTDGFPCEFYKFFFKDLGELLVKSFNFSFDSGKMSLDQRRAIINLIPKKNQDPMFLKNWRPISILNSDYKLLAKCLATRLKTILSEIISCDQTGFIKGRYIGENIQLALNMIDYDPTGFMLLADIEKAFDKLEWSYMFQALRYFNFGDELISWVKLLYADIYSCVVNNGHASEFFKVTRGVRQGCPLSPLLFIICNEVMSNWIKGDNNVEGIMINHVEIKINMYADDTTFYVKNTKSLFRILHILDNLKIYSGLCINRNKTEIIALGYYKANPPDISVTGLRYSDGPFRLLGVGFTTDSHDLFKLNFQPKLETLIRILRVWSQRDLTPLGKITIVKTLGLSQFIFLLSVLPKPPDTFIQEVESLIYTFIWNKKPDKIKRKTLIGDYNEGGLRMLHLQSIITGLKCAWIKRLLNSENNGKWKCFFNLFTGPLGGDLFWNCNFNRNYKLIHVNNIFIREIFEAWSDVTYSESPPDRYIHNQVIWNNSCIRINGKEVYKSGWIDNNVTRIKHLLNENNVFLTHVEFVNKYGIDCNFLEFYSIISAIPAKWKLVLKTPQLQNMNYQEELICNIKKETKVCKFVHRMCIEKLFQIPISQLKWNTNLLQPIDDWKKIYAIPFKSTLSTKIRYFQIKILHNILGVNRLLKIVGLARSDLCTFCSEAPETISHLFWECPVTKRFIQEFQTHILKNEVTLTHNDFIFGIPTGYFTTVNFVILYAKYYIFTTRCKEGRLSLSSFQNLLKYYYELERIIYSKQNKFVLFLDKWRNIQII